MTKKEFAELYKLLNKYQQDLCREYGEESCKRNSVLDLMDDVWYMPGIPELIKKE